MSDFSKKQPAPESRLSESRPPQDQGGNPEQCCDNCEAPKLGSDSIANFGAGPGVKPSNRKIR